MNLWDDEYTGERFTYGVNYRPVGLATVPAGYILKVGGMPDPRFKFGIVQYPARLPASQVAAFELTPVQA